MASTSNDPDLLPDQTEGFRVAEKKTMDEYNKLGRSHGFKCSAVNYSIRLLWTVLHFKFIIRASLSLSKALSGFRWSLSSPHSLSGYNCPYLFAPQSKPPWKGSSPQAPLFGFWITLSTSSANVHFPKRAVYTWKGGSNTRSFFANPPLLSVSCTRIRHFFLAWKLIRIDRLKLCSPRFGPGVRPSTLQAAPA